MRLIRTRQVWGLLRSQYEQEAARRLWELQRPFIPGAVPPRAALCDRPPLWQTNRAPKHALLHIFSAMRALWPRSPPGTVFLLGNPRKMGGCLSTGRGIYFLMHRRCGVQASQLSSPIPARPGRDRLSQHGVRAECPPQWQGDVGACRLMDTSWTEGMGPP